MTDEKNPANDATAEVPAVDAPAPPPAVAQVASTTKTRIGDVVFGWKAGAAIFAGGLILGGLGGAALTVIGGHDHHERGFVIQRDGFGGRGGPFGVPGQMRQFNGQLPNLQQGQPTAPKSPSVYASS